MRGQFATNSYLDHLNIGLGAGSGNATTHTPLTPYSGTGTTRESHKYDALWRVTELAPDREKNCGRAAETPIYVLERRDE